MGLSALQFALLLLAALLAGLSKTALNGIGPFTAAIAASVLPAGESTAVVLLWLIVGDLFAIPTPRTPIGGCCVDWHRQ